jgi:hypothetical protein
MTKQLANTKRRRSGETAGLLQKDQAYLSIKKFLFNEDDSHEFDAEPNNMYAAVSAYASWGLFIAGDNNYRDGYQSPPVNWGINTERKRAFFEYLDEITSSATRR